MRGKARTTTVGSMAHPGEGTRNGRCRRAIACRPAPRRATMPPRSTPRSPAMPPRLAALLTLALALAPARAEAPKRTHAVTLDDYFTIAQPTEVALSPDGKLAAYAEARWQKSSDDRQADLWVVSAEGGKPRRLTSDRRGARSLRWS